MAAWLPAWSPPRLAWSLWLRVVLHIILSSLAMQAYAMASWLGRLVRARRLHEALQLPEEGCSEKVERTRLRLMEWLHKPLLYLARVCWSCKILCVPAQCSQVSWKIMRLCVGIDVCEKQVTL